MLCAGKRPTGHAGAGRAPRNLGGSDACNHRSAGDSHSFFCGKHASKSLRSNRNFPHQRQKPLQILKHAMPCRISIKFFLGFPTCFPRAPNNRNSQEASRPQSVGFQGFGNKGLGFRGLGFLGPRDFRTKPSIQNPKPEVLQAYARERPRTLNILNPRTRRAVRLLKPEMKRSEKSESLKLEWEDLCASGAPSRKINNAKDYRAAWVRKDSLKNACQATCKQGSFGRDRQSCWVWRVPCGTLFVPMVDPDFGIWSLGLLG